MQNRGFQADLSMPVLNELDLPKNLNEYTFRLIWRYIFTRARKMTANEVAVGVGVSRSTARRYLLYCVEQGWLECVMSYLNVGRPRHQFQIKKARIQLKGIG